MHECMQTLPLLVLEWVRYSTNQVLTLNALQAEANQQSDRNEDDCKEGVEVRSEVDCNVGVNEGDMVRSEVGIRVGNTLGCTTGKHNVMKVAPWWVTLKVMKLKIEKMSI